MRIFSTLIILCATAICHAQTKFSFDGKALTSSRNNIYVSSKAKTNAKKFTFNSMNEALAFAEKNAADSTTIYIEPSVYWIDNPDDDGIRKPLNGENEPFGMKVRISNLKIIGLSKNPEDVVLACNRGQTQGAVGNFTMFHFCGDNISILNITLGNYCNVDLTYPLSPKLNRKKRNDAIVQAQLAICNGDNYKAENCRFISRLNLCPFAGARHATFSNCYFECTDDALCGTGTYNDCSFTFFSSKPFYTTSAQGATFNRCKIHTKVSGTQYLTKVSGPVKMIDCEWTSDDPNLNIKWCKDPNPKHLCIMQGNTLNGNPFNLPPTPNIPRPIKHPTLALQAQPEIIEGAWTLDAYKPEDTADFNWSIDKSKSPWCYGEGIDGAEGCYGMIQNVKGARMMFTAKSNENYKGQILNIDLAPCKSAGQGFGSATGQYLDICIKFDTKTLTGYGVRFVRTPQHDRAVDVYHVEYKDSKVTAICKAEKCTLFKKGCQLRLKATGDKLTATIKNGDKSQELSAVMQSPNKFGGIHIQHTGSTGASATVITAIHSEYTEK